MKNNVYWSNSRITPLGDKLDLLWEKPVTLLSEIKEEIKNKTLPDGSLNDHISFMNCPSMAKELSSIYVIKSPLSYSFTWDGNNLKSPDLNQQFMNEAVYIRDIETGIISLNFRPIFFADSPVNLTLTGPYFSNNSFANNIRMFPGSFDISKWFRPMDVTFQIKNKNIPITIKRGDHLMYIKLSSNHTIYLQKFDMTPEIDSFANKCIGLKYILPNKPLHFLYDLFTKKSGFNNRVLTLIKQNLITE